MQTKRLFAPLAIKAVDTSQRLIDGFAAAFHNKDRTGDIIETGAFDRTLKTNPDVLVFVGHDAARLPVGEPVWLRPDTKGLLTRTRIYETPAGDELLEVAKQRMASGKTLGMSIGYRTVKDRWQGGARHLLDVDLVEYSFLASPALAANPEATMVGLKARRKAAGGTTLLDASYEDLQGDLRAAAAEALGRSWCMIVATYVDHVIVMSDPDMGAMGEGGDDDDSAYWDFPYTLGPDGEPTLGEPKPVQPAFVSGALKAAAQKERRSMTTKPVTAATLNSLPDAAFAYIEADGTKDDGGLTTPRAKRHFPHHDAEGAVDVTQLKHALEQAPSSDFGDKALAHLERHAKAEGIAVAGKSGDDAHAAVWAEGTAPGLLVLASKMANLAEEIAADRGAMERLGLDTKRGARLNGSMRKKLKDLHGTLGQIIDWAEAIEAGDDGKRRVDTYRHKLALVALETA